MNPNNTPSRQHRPNRWARLKKQLTQARAEAETAKRQRDWAQMYIATIDLWQEFSRWAQEQADSDTNPTDTLCRLYAQATAEAEQATRRLSIAQKMAQMYEEQAKGYYKTIGTMGGQIDALLATVASLSEKATAQRTKPD